MNNPFQPGGALVLFSGGQDSTVCLAWALGRFERVETVGFNYGQRHGVELSVRDAVRDALTVNLPHWAGRLGPDHLIDIRAFGEIGETAMTEERAIAVTQNGLPNTFVPGRNLVFLTYAAALADRRGLVTLVGGMCETDYSGYPDCRRATLDSLQEALTLGMDRKITIETPLMYLSKAETWGLAKALGGEPLVALTIKHTHTCYLGNRDPNPWGAGCGTCPACALRAKGFAQWEKAGRPALAE